MYVIVYVETIGFRQSLFLDWCRWISPLLALISTAQNIGWRLALYLFFHDPAVSAQYILNFGCTHKLQPVKINRTKRYLSLNWIGCVWLIYFFFFIKGLRYFQYRFMSVNVCGRFLVSCYVLSKWALQYLEGFQTNKIK